MHIRHRAHRYVANYINGRLAPIQLGEVWSRPNGGFIASIYACVHTDSAAEATHTRVEKRARIHIPSLSLLSFDHIRTYTTTDNIRTYITTDNIRTNITTDNIRTYMDTDQKPTQHTYKNTRTHIYSRFVPFSFRTHTPHGQNQDTCIQNTYAHTYFQFVPHSFFDPHTRHACSSRRRRRAWSRCR